MKEDAFPSGPSGEELFKTPEVAVEKEKQPGVLTVSGQMIGYASEVARLRKELWFDESDKAGTISALVVLMATGEHRLFIDEEHRATVIARFRAVITLIETARRETPDLVKLLEELRRGLEILEREGRDTS